MTLVISMLTQDCVWQVADRRLTNRLTGAVVSRDTNKAIHFAHSMIFAYTGPAQLEGSATPVFIADQLSDGPDADANLHRLPETLDAAISRLPRAARPFAVDGVGWAVDRQTGLLQPRLFRVSNCIDAGGVWTNRMTDTATVFDGMLKPAAPLNIRAAGQPIPLAVGRFWERIIRRRLTRRDSLGEAGRCLVEWVRDVARDNTSVGSGVLLSAIPRSAILQPTGMTIASMPLVDQPTFKYFPEDAQEGIDKGPEVSGPGGHRMSGFHGETLPDGTQTVTVSFRVPSSPPRS